MAKEKKSFFERLTGTVRVDEDEAEVPATNKLKKITTNKVGGDSHDTEDAWIEAEATEAELTVDVFQTPDAIVIKAMTAGVDPNDLDVSIARDMVIIRGHREEEKTARTEDYFIQELYWGSFSRTITLPEEIDVDEAEAVGKHGLLILKLPKLDKKRQTKLKVKTI